MNNVKVITSFLEQLTSAKIHYSIRHNRNDALSIEVAVPGQRWEIDFLDDDSIEIEIFLSDGEIFGKEKLKDLFSQFSD